MGARRPYPILVGKCRDLFIFSMGDFGTDKNMEQTFCMRRGEAALAKTIASLMVMQHNKLDWPIPDWIIPCPTHLFPSFHSQGKLTRQVALETAKIFGRPVCNALKKSIDYAYFGVLDSKQKPIRFSAALYKRADLSDKALLLVSLNPDQEERKQACEHLQGFFPKEVYSLSFLSSSD